MVRFSAALGVCLCAVTARAAAEAPRAATSLASVLDDVRARSPSLAAARARISAARRMRDASGRPNDPMLTVEVDRLGWAAGAASPMLRYTLEQPLPTPGALGMDERVAEHATEQVEADLETLQRDLESDTAHAYVMLWRTQGELEVVAAQRRLVENLIAAALARMNAGADTHHDIIQSQVEDAALQSQAARISAERTTAIAMLNALRNRPYTAADADMVASEPIALPDQIEPVAALQVRSLRTRSELRSAGAMADGERAEAELMRRDGWPMFSVGAWYNQDLDMPDSVGVMVRGTLPVFSAARQSARASASLARASAADAQRRDFALTIGAQVRGATARYEATQQRVALLHDVALPRAEQALLQANSSYRAGTLGFASVVQDERTLAELRMELVAAQAERYDAYIALLRATGRSVRVQQRP